MFISSGRKILQLLGFTPK